MTRFLVDTSCISELVSPGLIAWINATDENLLFLSVRTLSEIRKGVAALPQSKKRTHLETWLGVDLKVRFAGRIVSIDAAVADRWGLLSAAAKRAGKTLSAIDGLLGATALQHNLTIVSRNVGEFASIPVEVSDA